MYTKHLLKTLTNELTHGDCLWCGPNTPIVKSGRKYVCANDETTKKTIKNAPDKLAARLKAFTGKADRLQREYNLTYEQYLTLLDTYEYMCAICSEAFTKDSPPHIDHDHNCCPNKQSCGQCIRGLL